MATGTSRKRQTTTRKRTSNKRTEAKRLQEESMIRSEILILILFTISILLLISNFGVGGAVGGAVSGFMFGLFGLFAYVLPIVLFLVTAFSISNRDSTIASIKVAATVAAGILCCCFLHLLTGPKEAGETITAFYTYSSTEKTGGGILGGLICKLLSGAFGMVGTWIILLVLLIISLVIITERSFIGGVKHKGRRVYDTAKEDAKRMRQVQAERAARRRELLQEQKERKVARMEKKVSGVALNTTIQENTTEDFVEELLPEVRETEIQDEPAMEVEIPLRRQKMNKLQEITLDEPDLKDLDELFDLSSSHTGFQAKRVQEKEMEEVDEFVEAQPEVSSYAAYEKEDTYEKPASFAEEMTFVEETDDVDEDFEEPRRARPVRKATSARMSERTEHVVPEKAAPKPVVLPSRQRSYVFPPINLLKQGTGSGGSSESKLKETAMHLQQILRDFGVGVTVTDVSCGPSVTRYELQPDQGVKVSRIVALADDIKLNLAVADVRIEAPIPGKAAVGIEVPNAENTTVALRELLSSNDFKSHKSNIAFAVGKDIAGKIIVSDIAKMPHLLIAGATGSGKSVCINTLIMSILYKADPDDVKLIMVDPKVVELSVYNGIPHLLIPVVTDPKKAAAALNWAVAEMTDRYKKFAECNVRNLQGYNEKIRKIEDIEDEEKPKKLPQIVIIVDELADLMMVASSEVEDAICRLAQLARAAGIHLIIATQRPSVNVITGLIKANMPSRLAFAVSSGVDSRTILDMNGAEKLLGKGDMLFYPSGLPKPVRVQGAFVSDEEVGAVVDFLSQHNTEVAYSNEIEEHISSSQAAVNAESAAGGTGGSSQDVLFAEAGRFIIEKDKASIGMLQRWFKVGFNRAARIMDQLAEAGVVGEEAGTKPREILMTMEAFEQYLKDTM